MICFAAATHIALAMFQQKLEVKLTELKPVSQTQSGNMFTPQEAFSMGGIVMQDGTILVPNQAPKDSEGLLVYAIPAGAHTFKAQFGFSDTVVSSGFNDSATLGVYLDGDLIKEYNASKGLKPVKIELPIGSAKSLKLLFKGYSALGEGRFSYLATKPAEPPVSTPSSTPGTLGKIALTAPENGEKTRDKAVFKWDAVEGAAAYGVEIVMVSNATKVVPTRFIRAFTAKSNTFEWVYSDDVVSGEYQVSVIAFSKKGVITRFSPARKFIVERRSASKPGNL